MPPETAIQKSSDKMQSMELHEFEVCFINKMRGKYRFGELTIVVQDGLPIRIKKAEFRESLKTNN